MKRLEIPLARKNQEHTTYKTNVFDDGYTPYFDLSALTPIQRLLLEATIDAHLYNHPPTSTFPTKLRYQSTRDNFCTGIRSVEVEPGPFREKILQMIIGLVESNALIDEDTISTMCACVADACDRYENIHSISSSGGRVNVFGDIHGHFFDAVLLTMKATLPSEKNKFVFNGDIVDRGEMSVETISFLYGMVCLFPEYVFIVRGNHESKRQNERIWEKDKQSKDRKSFVADVLEKYGESKGRYILKYFQSSFDYLPVGILIDNETLVCHGGFPIQSTPWGFMADPTELSEIQMMNRRKDIVNMTDNLSQIMWLDLADDPNLPKRSEKTRAFTITEFKNFMGLNKLTCLIRSHQCVPNGYMNHVPYTHVRDGKEIKLYTVFSAGNYCGSGGNKIGKMVVQRGKVTCRSYPPKHYPLE